jgi:hypothetical protein
MHIPGHVGPGVDGHQFQILIGGSHKPGEAPADPPEAIDGHSDRHFPSKIKYPDR